MTAIDEKAIEYLKNNQRQLDADGVEVGVSRQALDMLLAWYTAAQPSGWLPISTRPYSDDLMWFAKGDNISGPEWPSLDDADYYDWWCYCVAPPFSQPPSKEGV